MSKLALMEPTSINVEDKYKYMIAPSHIKNEGVADDAWDDWFSNGFIPCLQPGVESDMVQEWL